MNRTAGKKKSHPIWMEPTTICPDCRWIEGTALKQEIFTKAAYQYLVYQLNTNYFQRNKAATKSSFVTALIFTFNLCGPSWT